jgi:Chain length determinant protein
MPDEEIDKLIKDAANQHHPPFDSGAWDKMEELLDKHMPQKKRRKKVIFFFLLFLLVGGVISVAVEKNYTNKTTIANNFTDGNKKSAVNNLITTTTNNLDSSSDLNNKTEKINLSNKNNTPTSTLTKTIKSKRVIIKTGQGNFIDDNQYNYNKTKKRNTKGRFNVTVKKPAIANGKDNIAVTPAESTDNTSSDNVDGVLPLNNLEITITDKELIDKKDTIIEPAINEKDSSKSTTPTSSKKTKKTLGSKIAILVAAGTDQSFVSINKTEKIKLLYGAGISYQVSNSVAISAGFYVANKKYTATPTQYKTTGYVNPMLKSIDALCKVYEIPLTIHYNSKTVKKHNWFGAVGISSFLMKKEDYNYLYVRPNGTTWTYNHFVSNKNNHYFSVLTLSAGYQYTLNKHLALLAGPYLKIPLGGIGDGAVKLKSAGLLITASIKPFVKKKK